MENWGSAALLMIVRQMTAARLLIEPQSHQYKVCYLQGFMFFGVQARVLVSNFQRLKHTAKKYGEVVKFKMRDDGIWLVVFVFL